MLCTHLGSDRRHSAVKKEENNWFLKIKDSWLAELVSSIDERDNINKKCCSKDEKCKLCMQKYKEEKRYNLKKIPREFDLHKLNSIGHYIILLSNISNLTRTKYLNYINQFPSAKTKYPF